MRLASVTCGIVFLVVCFIGINAITKYDSEDWKKLGNQTYESMRSIANSSFFNFYVFIASVICHVMYIKLCFNKDPEENIVMEEVFVVSTDAKRLTENISH